MSDELGAQGFSVAHYHAGLSPNDRSAVQEMFGTEAIKCIVATIAFGMGVDKSNVRNVIHYGAPRNPETTFFFSGRKFVSVTPPKPYKIATHALLLIITRSIKNCNVDIRFLLVNRK